MGLHSFSPGYLVDEVSILDAEQFQLVPRAPGRGGFKPVVPEEMAVA